MSVIILNNDRKLYELVEKFFSELIIDVHRIKQLGLSEYLRSVHSDSFAYLSCHEMLEFFYSGSIHALERELKNGIIPIDSISKHFPIDMILEKRNSHLIITVNHPVEMFLDKRKNKTDKLPIVVQNLTVSASKKRRTTYLSILSGECIKDIVITCNEKPCIHGSGYIELDVKKVDVQKILSITKEVEDDTFGGRIKWCPAGVKGCTRLTKQSVKTIFGSHILFITENMKERYKTLDRVYRILKQVYEDNQIFNDNGIDRSFVFITRKSGTIIIELKIPFNIPVDEKDTNINEPSDLQDYDLIVTARMKIDFEVGDPQIL